jgi:hypothetical protein
MAMDAHPLRADWFDDRWDVVTGPCAPGGSFVLRADLLGWPLRTASGRTILVGRQGDLLDAGLPRAFVMQVFGVMASALQHTFLILTRHPQRLGLLYATLDRLSPLNRPGRAGQWLPNLCVGLPAGGTADLTVALPRLLLAPAASRWLLLEGPVADVDLTRLHVRDEGLTPSAWHVPARRSVVLNALTGCIHENGALVTRVARVDRVITATTGGSEALSRLEGQCRQAGVPMNDPSAGTSGAAAWQMLHRAGAHDRRAAVTRLQA